MDDKIIAKKEIKELKEWVNESLKDTTDKEAIAFIKGVLFTLKIFEIDIDAI